MFKQPIAVLVSGKAGVGKSTLAHYAYLYCKELHLNPIIAPFAYGLKSIARLVDWDGAKDEKGRNLLIELGAVARKYNENVWADYTFNKFLPATPCFPYDIVFVDDWRFPNEGKFVKNLGWYIVKKIRVKSPERECLKGTTAYSDISETSLPSWDDGFYDFIIPNLWTLDILKEQAERLVDQILIDTADNIYGRKENASIS